jgi:site-specific DNA recombinase
MKPASARAALYGRVSQDHRGGRSVAEQESESRAACEVNGWTLAGTYTDNDISASRFTTAKRAEWTKLVADLDAGRFDVLVLWEPSRGSRELMTWAALLDACRRRKVLVHVTSHQHTYDLSKPRDWRSLAEDGVDSAYESEKASQRVRRSMTAGAVAGRPHGRCPYGYVRRYDPATKALIAQEADPATAPVVREIFRRLAAAEPVSVVTNDLNARGVPSAAGKTWHRQIVRKVALNHGYIGQRDYAGEIHHGDWPALVDPEVWYAARRVLLDPKRTTTKPGKAKYLLSYIARCGVCGERLQAAKRHGGPAYYCTRFHVGTRAEWLDSVITPLVLARLDDKDLMARLSGGDDEDVVAARTEVAALQERLEGFRDAAASGELTAASLAHVESRLLVGIETAKRKAASAAVPSVLRGIAGPGDVAARWDALSIAGRRQIISTLLEVRLDPASKRGPGARTDFDRVKIEWRH